MKQNLKNYFILLLTLLVLTLLSSLILTVIDKNQILTYKTCNIIANSLSYLFFAIISFILGVKVKRKGIFHGILLSLIMICLTLIFGNDLSQLTTIIKVVTKSLIIIFFTILGVNKRNSN